MQLLLTFSVLLHQYPLLHLSFHHGKITCSLLQCFWPYYFGDRGIYRGLSRGCGPFRGGFRSRGRNRGELRKKDGCSNFGKVEHFAHDCKDFRRVCLTRKGESVRIWPAGRLGRQAVPNLNTRGCGFPGPTTHLPAIGSSGSNKGEPPAEEDCWVIVCMYTLSALLPSGTFSSVNLCYVDWYASL